MNALKYIEEGNDMKQKEQHMAFHHWYFSYITSGVSYLSAWYRFQAQCLPQSVSVLQGPMAPLLNS